MEKRFHKSDAIIYTYNSVEYPIPKSNPEFTRKMVLLHASEGVTWQDIVHEIHSYRKKPELSPDKVLLTVMADYPEFVVALTLDGCIKIVKDLAKLNPLPSEYAWFEQVDGFAKEMIAQRDYLNYVMSLDGKPIQKQPQDFIPA